VTQGFEIWEADRLDGRLAPYDWPFAADADGVVAEHWRAQTRLNPRIYDGTVLMCRPPRAAVEEDGERVLHLEFFEARFSRFLAWRNFGWPDDGVRDCFSMPALRSSDGAFLLGEMAAGHSQPGKIYFPCGTPDCDDVRDGRVDLAGSLMRELAEETGIRIAEKDLSPSWSVVFCGAQIACIRIIDWPEPAAALAATVERFIASEKAPELARVHLISRRAELRNPNVAAFVTGFLERELPE